MFDLKLDDPNILRKTVAVLADFITEATFTITKNGVSLIAMDPANICMVNMLLLPSAFTSFKTESDAKITVNVDYLQQALRRAKNTDVLELGLESNKLKLTLRGRGTKRFLIPLLEEEETDRKVPQLEFKSKVELDAKEFKDYVDDVAIAGDAVTFEVDSEKLSVKAGETASKVHIDISKESDAMISIESKEKTKSIFSVEYLKKIASAAALTDAVTLQISNDYPIKLNFKALNKLQMEFILAPRIENK